MPTYEYACDECSHREDQVRNIGQRDESAPCPKCSFGFLKRDVVASMQPHTDMGYNTPILSDSLGVHPSQIAEAKQRFPHHNFAPDGRMILSGHGERNKILKELGFYDKG